MLKTRIIPSLLLKDGRMVKSVQFADYRDVGHPVTTAKIYDAQRADELLFLDISASREDRKTFLDLVQTVAEECFMPLGVGGGITSVNEIRDLLKSGADKIVINTAAVENPELIQDAARRFGSSTIVVSIDVKKNPNGRDEVFIRGASEPTGLDPVVWAKQVEDLGAGEILLTSVDREGTMAGYDLPLLAGVVSKVSIPVIAHGGAGKLSDFKDAISAGASAVSAASIFHFTDQSPIKARKYLFDQGVNVRV